MRKIWRVLMPLIAILIGSVLVTAQTTWAQNVSARAGRKPPPVPPEKPRNPNSSSITAPEPGLRFISSEMSFSGKVVKHAPYSAEILTESTQTLGNGAKLTRRTMGLVYRDSEGRTRREQSATIAGPFATEGDTQRLIFINDPVAGVSSTINPDSDTAHTRALPAANQDAPPDTEVSPGNSRVESLGSLVIEGFEAEGTRTTISIPAGRIGNDKPLEIVHERWYSPELQMILQSKHSDPRWGETVYKLFNISRSEPDRSLFSLPTTSTPNKNKSRPRQ